VDILKVVVQRVNSACVKVNGKAVGKIKKGLLMLIGIAQTDTEKDIEFIADKCANLRIFQDENGKMNRTVLEEKGEILAISQFTLLGDTRKGRRPNFMAAASPEKGEKFYHYFIHCLKKYGIHVESGIFGAMMNVELINTGPVTLIVESK
jgi:D-tyrosyl-tRNA(Tyr) deacylase